ncbi:MAG: putative CXXCH cytochrome family protein [Kiritimatiellia bacterium]|jgi:predicted CXXCH cytochrome family protein
MASSRNNDRPWSWPIGVLIALGWMLVLSVGCESTRKHAVLNFFFDGVPVPGGTQTSAEPQPSAAPVKVVNKTAPVAPKFILHEPFELKECADCHKSTFSQALVKEEPLLCYACHGKIMKKMTVLHKPSGDGTCKLCHLAHKSPYDYLLPKPELELCNDCHDPVNTLPVVHEPIVKGQCSVCHNPHGAHDPFLLVTIGNPLCYDCHKAETFAHTPGHKEMGERACTECHDPHQSQFPDLLKNLP